MQVFTEDAILEDPNNTDSISNYQVVVSSGRGAYDFGSDDEGALFIDLQSAANTDQTIYLVFDIQNSQAGLVPRNNKIRCSCGKKEKWDQFFYANGVTADTLAGLVDASESTYAYGFRLQLSVACGNSWLCQQFDFVNDPWARVMAECIALYGMKKLAGMILVNPYPEKYTMITREEIAFHRDRINTLLGERMPWLAANLPHYYQDCFACNDKARAIEYLV
jgi:hypothetical protein